MAKKKSKRRKAETALTGPSSSGWKANRIPRVFLNPWLWLFLIILVGLGFRLSNATFTPLTYPDSLQYMSLADDIRSGEIFSRDYNLDEGFIRSRHLPPFYSLLLAGLSFLPIEPEVLGSWISIVLSLSSFVPLFWLGRKLESAVAGLAAACIFSFQWFGLRYATPLLTEATFTFLYLLIITLSIYAFSRPRIWLLALLGLLSGLAYLTRDVGITLVFWVIVAGGFYWRFMARTHGRMLVARIGIILGVFLLVSFPYWLHIRVHTGEWGLSPQMGQDQLSGQVLQFGGSRIDRDKVTNEDLRESQSGAGDFIGGSSGIFVLPKKLLILFKDYFYQFLKHMGWFLSILFFAGYILAYVLLFRSRNREGIFREVYVLIWILQLVGLYALVTPYMVDERYIYPIMPLGMLVAGAGMVRIGRVISGVLAESVPAWSSREQLISILVPVLLVVAAFPALYPAYKDFHKRIGPAGMHYKYSAGHKEVAQEVISRGLVPPGRVILGRKPFMAYYLKGKHEPMPKTYPELLSIIEDKKADYIVADSFVLNALRPLLEPIAFGLQPDPNPEIVYISEKEFLVRSRDITYYPAPNTRIIYSRCLPEYRRVITIYEIQPEGLEPDTLTGTPQEHLASARRNIAGGYYYDALRELEKALELDPETEDAYRYITLIYQQYFIISPHQYFLVPMERAAYIWLNLDPKSHEAREVLRFVNKAHAMLDKKR